MAQITLKGNPIHTNGELPEVGSTALDFALVDKELATVSLKKFKGKQVVLNIFPSLDTPVCSMSVRKFNQLAEQMENTVVLCISKDLPFAQARFCGAEGLEQVITLSEFRNDDFSTKYGVKIIDGPMQGLMARAVVILNEKLEVIYTELVPEIAQEPNYDKALEQLK
jgi:thioredoxin-dependent peroxiredoxin